MSSNKVCKTIKAYKQDLDVSKIKISDLKKLDSGAEIAYMSYNGDKFVIRTPTMKSPYMFGTTYNDVQKHELTLSFGNYKTDDALNKFYNNMKSLENHIIDHGIKNSAVLFPKTKGKSKEFIEEMIKDQSFVSFVKPYREKDTKQISDKCPPTMKLKVPLDKDTKMYNIPIQDLYTGEKYDFNEVKDRLKGADIQLCFRITGIYNISATMMFGISAKITNMKVSFPDDGEDDWGSDSDDDIPVKKPTKTQEDDDDDLNAELAEKMQSLKLANKKKSNKAEIPEDSEDEDTKPQGSDDEFSSEVVVSSGQKDEQEDSDDSDAEGAPEQTNEVEDDSDDSDDSDEEEIKPVSKTVKKTVATSKEKKPVTKTSSKKK